MNIKKIISFLVIALFVMQIVPILPAEDDDVQVKTITESFTKPDFLIQKNMMKINIDEANEHFSKSMYYSLPQLTKQLSFPIGTTIKSITGFPKNIHTEPTLFHPPITPTPVLLSNIDAQPTISTTLNNRTQQISTLHSWLTYDIKSGIIKNNPELILKLFINPVLFNADEQTINWIEEIEIKITYAEPKNQPLQQGSVYDLIIITSEDFSDELIPLANHKNQYNRSTKIVTLDEITNGAYFPVQGRDLQENIKYFIKSSIEKWGTSFVFLVGDSESMPTRNTHIHASSGDSEVFVSDLYYADIYNETGSFSSWDTNNNDIFAEYDWGMEERTDEMDLLPDVFLGRAACIDETQVTTIVNKIITYETQEAFTTNWFTNLTVIGGDSFTPNHGEDTGTNEGELVNQEVIDIMEGFIPTKVWDSNGALNGLNPTGITSINNAINTGCGFVDFSGHGAPWVWTTYPNNGTRQTLPTPTGLYRNTEIGQLSNGDQLPIVITGACSVGKFNEDDNCFSWSFLANPNGGGIASAGATALGYAYIGKWVTRGLIEKMTLNMFEAYQDGASTFGEMWANALTDYLSWNMDAVDYKTMLEWQPFGDPSLRIASDSQSPITPNSPTGPSSGRIKEEHTFEAVTTDPDEDELYYLFDWGNGDFSGWIGPYDSGDTAQAIYTWEEKGDYQIRVKAKDEHGKQSDWSDPMPITMPNSQDRSMWFLDVLRSYFSIFNKQNRFFDLSYLHI
ncbi:MAG: hypothetical protein KGY67_07830 [Candidatus Thermoplasmatota archaeon]|nr:hypothetical protein [Candidatus Thermoplasmatota archaeon]